MDGTAVLNVKTICEFVLSVRPLVSLQHAAPATDRVDVSAVLTSKMPKSSTVTRLAGSVYRLCRSC
ncbi:hypothetical protein PF003_g9886 [Phytophthora fragariae]|nr:hypothetical protein PF003_g9886 [Phytophthora fragariae]